MNPVAKSLTDRLAELETLSTAELCARWERASGRSAPNRARDLLLRALAYHLQEHAQGGLSKAARRRLAKLAGLKGEASQPPVPPSPRLRPGSRLVREWRGEAHQVTVLEKGFEYGGTPYPDTPASVVGVGKRPAHNKRQKCAAFRPFFRRAWATPSEIGHALPL